MPCRMYPLTNSKLCFASRKMMNNMFIVSYSYLCMQLVSLGFCRYVQQFSVPHLHRWEGSRTEGPLPDDQMLSPHSSKTCILYCKPKRKQLFLVLHNKIISVICWEAMLQIVYFNHFFHRICITSSASELRFQ